MIIGSYICRKSIDFDIDWFLYFQGSHMGTAVALRSRTSAAVEPLARFFFTHSFRTNRLQGRDQVVFWVSKSFHTCCADSPEISGSSSGDHSEKLLATRDCSGPRSQRAHGKVKVRFLREVTSRGNNSPSASINKALGIPPRFFSAAGSERANSTTRWSRNGTRTSKELAMLIPSVSRSRVLDI